MKKLFALLIALALLLSFAACGKNNSALDELAQLASDLENSLPSDSKIENTLPAGNESGDTVIAMARDEVESRLKNYKITMKGSFSEDTADMIITEMHWDKGHVTQFTEDALTYVDLENKKSYILDTKNKTGIVMENKDDSLNLFQGFVGTWLFTYDQHKDEAFRKTGREKVAGRNAVVYTSHVTELLLDMTTKLWIDEEYGVTLKMFATDANSNVTTSFEATEVKIGGVSLADMVSLDEYQLTDMTSLESLAG